MSNDKFSEDQKKHLEFIQNVITRMNTNSFQVKVTMITIVTALWVWSFSNPKIEICFTAMLSIAVIVVFWLCDSYILWTERKYRDLFDDVAHLNSDTNKQIKLYDMTINDKYPEQLWWNAFKSTTMLLTYLSFVILCLVFCYLAGRINIVESQDKEIPFPKEVKIVIKDNHLQILPLPEHDE